MRDPFMTSPWFREAIQPLADRLHLYTLSLHIQEVLLSFLVYVTIDVVVSPFISKLFFAKIYADFPERTKLQWNMHVTAFANSVFLVAAASYVMYADQERPNQTWEDRLWGYTGASGMVQALGAGYFLWDVQVSAMNMDHLGVLDLLHAVVGLTITMLGFRPFGLYYGMQYALLEVSTPFANMHWFLKKLNMSGSRLYVVNGLILMVTFASCRLLWGSYLTFVFFRDVWEALHASQTFETAYYYSSTQKPLLIQHEAVWWVASVIMIANAVVMSLSFYWFSKMVVVAWKNFSPDGKTSRSKVA